MDLKELLKRARENLDRCRDPQVVIEVERHQLVMLLDYIDFLESELAIAKIEATFAQAG